MAHFSYRITIATQMGIKHTGSWNWTGKHVTRERHTHAEREREREREVLFSFWSHIVTDSDLAPVNSRTVRQHRLSGLSRFIVFL